MELGGRRGRGEEREERGEGNVSLVDNYRNVQKVLHTRVVKVCCRVLTMLTAKSSPFSTHLESSVLESETRGIYVPTVRTFCLESKVPGASAGPLN